jgi:ParB family transcriptional regulator, chromosome partitioning protein
MMAKMKGLGRGLDALLGGEDRPQAAGGELTHLAIDALVPGRYQPRTRMHEESLLELAESIKVQGVMQPILVRPTGERRYEIVAGERRWRAARIAGLTEVPVLVRDVPDRHALAAALIENIQREDLNPLEEASGIQRLIQEFGLTHAAAAEALGRSRTGVTNLLRLLELAPPVRELLMQGKLEMGHARALLSLPVVRQIELAREAAARRWSVREVEKHAAAATGPQSPRRKVKPDRDVARLEQDLSDRLGTQVQIKTGPNGRGRLLIRYHSLDELDALVTKLAGG